MIALIEDHKDEMTALCRQYGVARLAVFGSAVNGAFAPDRSDLDFLVRFLDRRPTGRYATQYLDLADALENLFGRPVDLVTEQSIRNPFFREGVEATREIVYERADAEAVV
jgi:predicted nucleotidyltransferase